MLLRKSWSHISTKCLCIYASGFLLICWFHYLPITYSSLHLRPFMNFSNINSLCRFWMSSPSRVEPLPSLLKEHSWLQTITKWCDRFYMLLGYEYLKMNQQFSSIFVPYSLKKWDLWCWTCYFHWYEPHSSQFRMFMWVLSGSYFLGCCICATHSAFQFCQVQILWIYFLLYRVLQT